MNKTDDIPDKVEPLSTEDKAETVDNVRKEMELLADKTRDLVLLQPPIELLGYLLAQFQMSMMFNPDGTDDAPRPNTEAVKTFQFALEYVHAVWSCHADLKLKDTSFDENAAGELLNTLSELEEQTMLYCLISSLTQTEFHAKTTWTMIRGHRYQVLEEEFFRFVLEPHDDALREAYGVGFADIALGIQNIANAFRGGLNNAVTKLEEHMEATFREIEDTSETLEAVIKKRRSDSAFTSDIADCLNDMLFGGVCNLSRHSNLPRALLEDISYEPGENIDFFDGGPFTGTPMRRLPARIKPGIKLGEEFYAADGQFVRDSAYRAIQWGLWKRLPYRDEWLKRQGHVVEQSFQLIFLNQLKDARIYKSVYYRDIDTNQWVETDRLILLEDILLVVEAKAGVMPMQSPSTNFKSHERVIQDLIVKAYRQCRRFIDYLTSADEKELYKLEDGEYKKIATIRREDFRMIFPIGLTVEAFTPFSAMAKELAGIEVISGQHAFMSMSVDDLFVLKRFLPTTGELFHYLEVRQQVAGLKGALLFDELDHLGAYITKNRFDLDIKDQLEQNDQVSWDGFSDSVDQFFEGKNWQTDSPPTQPYPLEVLRLLTALDELRPPNWLKFDTALRNYGQSGRDNIGQYIHELQPTLKEYPKRRFLIADGEPLQIWLCRQNSLPTENEVKFQAQVACLTIEATEMPIIVISYNAADKIVQLICQTFVAPSVIQSDFGLIFDEAQRQRERIIRLC